MMARKPGTRSGAGDEAARHPVQEPADIDDQLLRLGARQEHAVVDACGGRASPIQRSPRPGSGASRRSGRRARRRTGRRSSSRTARLPERDPCGRALVARSAGSSTVATEGPLMRPPLHARSPCRLRRVRGPVVGLIGGVRHQRTGRRRAASRPRAAPGRPCTCARAQRHGEQAGCSGARSGLRCRNRGRWWRAGAAAPRCRGRTPGP